MTRDDNPAAFQPYVTQVQAALPLCPGIDTSPEVADLATATQIINEGIVIAETAGNAGVVVPDPSAICQTQTIALAPMPASGTASTPAESAALAFYAYLAPVVGAERISQFASDKALEQYVKQKGYSRTAGISLIGPAVGQSLTVHA